MSHTRMKKEKEGRSGIESVVVLTMMTALWIIVGHLLDVYVGRWAMWIMVCVLLVYNIYIAKKSK